MIPKIIHYCWLSGDPIPEEFQNYMKTWKEKLSDYEFILWDRTRFDIHSVKWVEQAYEAKKYAFAADYIRLFAIYNYGGFYMDMDVEVRKSFNDILDHPYVLGAEYITGIEAGVFGAEKDSPVIKTCLDFYKNKVFKNEDGSFNIFGLPIVMFNQLSSAYKIKFTSTPDFSSSSELQVYPFEFFTAKSSDTGIVKPTKNTYTIHHFAGSWLPVSYKHKLKVFFANLFGEKMTRVISNILNNSNA